LYRLDRNTSGLVIFAKKPEIQHQLSLQELQKEYLGLLQNCPPEGAGVIKFRLAASPAALLTAGGLCERQKVPHKLYGFSEIRSRCLPRKISAAHGKNPSNQGAFRGYRLPSCR
jgi:hypothetical protein